MQHWNRSYALISLSASAVHGFRGRNRAKLTPKLAVMVFGLTDPTIAIFVCDAIVIR